MSENRSPAERFVLERLEDPRSGGRPISERARRSRRTLENYLKAGMRPRWMERLIEIAEWILEQFSPWRTAPAARPRTPRRP